MTAAGQLLQNILVDIDKNSEILFGHMTSAESGRFFRSLSTISAGQVELGPEPAVLRRSLVPVWIVGFYGLENSFQSENSDPQRKISSESNSSEKSNESLADTYLMKQLKIYPDANIKPSFQVFKIFVYSLKDVLR